MRLLLVIFLFFLAPSHVYGQTCCSSGVPIASNLGFQSKGRKILQLSLGIEHNNLQRLFSEATRLDDNNRLRITNTFLTRFSYGLTERINIEALVPWVSQRRDITQNDGNINSEGGSGLGDIAIMPQFDIIDRDFSTLSLGVGIKSPTGSNDVRNSDGFLVVNDLQLGSNAFDLIAKASYFLIPVFRPTASIFASSTYLARGTDKEYLGSQTYKFGNEIQFNFGASEQVIISDQLLIPSLALRSRYAVNDRIAGKKLDNTGGFWLFGSIGFSVDVYKGNRISINTEIPMYTYVEGTQLSPSYIVNISYYKAFEFNSKSQF